MEALNRSFEPMDIDRSSSVTDNFDMSCEFIDSDWEFVNTDIEVKTSAVDKTSVINGSCQNKLSNNIKKYHINIQRDTKDTSNKYLKIVAVLFILALSVIIAHIFNVRCTEDMSLDSLKTDLYRNVYGQATAIDGLIEALKLKESKLIIVYGGTGVGKTYTASLLMENFGHTSNLYHYTMPSFNTKFSVDFLFGLTLCKNSMFIIDDLNKDMQIKTSLNDLVRKSKILDKIVTIILIYNCMNSDGVRKECDQYFGEKLMKNFEDIDIIKKNIKFEQLTEEHLNKCIENEIGSEMTKAYDLKSVYKNFNVAIDGCKGVHAKMKLYRVIN